MDTPLKLDPQAVEAIARRVAELLGIADSSPMRFVDATVVAERLGVDREWVYIHADHLGAIRLGGPHGRLRFDLQNVKERLEDTWATPSGSPKWEPKRPAPRGRRVGGASLNHKLKSVPNTKSGRGTRKRPRPDTGR